jgi:glycosyltransferase involved in cell wall biosynthesis
MIKLSIITINYNNRDGLEKTIRSVIDQRFTDFEFIVIDGGSTDGSVDNIRKYENKINYWCSEKDAGIYNAQNKGIKKAKGEYCLFLNSGDFLYNEDVLNKIFSKKFHDDIIYGDMIIDYGNGKLVYGPQPKKISFEYLIHTTLWHPVSFIKRELFDKFGNYNEELKIISDYEFFVKTILVGKVSTRHIEMAVAVFNTAGIGSSSEHDAAHQSERRYVQEKYFSKAEIDAAKSYNLTKQNRKLAISNWFKKHPIIKIPAKLFLNMINSVKSLLRR